MAQVYYLHLHALLLHVCLASVFLLTGIRLRDTVEQLLHKELVCADANERVKSLQRYVLCCARTYLVSSAISLQSSNRFHE